MAEADSQSMADKRRRSHQDLRRRTIAHMQARTTDLAPEPRTIDPAIYAMWRDWVHGYQNFAVSPTYKAVPGADHIWMDKDKLPPR